MRYDATLNPGCGRAIVIALMFVMSVWNAVAFVRWMVP